MPFATSMHATDDWLRVCWLHPSPLTQSAFHNPSPKPCQKSKAPAISPPPPFLFAHSEQTSLPSCLSQPPEQTNAAIVCLELADAAAAAAASSPCFELIATRDIAAGEEVLVSYAGSAPEAPPPPPPSPTTAEAARPRLPVRLWEAGAPAPTTKLLADYGFLLSPFEAQPFVPGELEREVAALSALGPRAALLVAQAIAADFEVLVADGAARRAAAAAEWAALAADAAKAVAAAAVEGAAEADDQKHEDGEDDKGDVDDEGDASLSCYTTRSRAQAKAIAKAEALAAAAAAEAAANGGQGVGSAEAERELTLAERRDPAPRPEVDPALLPTRMRLALLHRLGRASVVLNALGEERRLRPGQAGATAAGAEPEAPGKAPPPVVGRRE